MKPIKPKKPNKLAPVWLRNAIVTKLTQMQSRLFEQPRPCPRCKSTRIRKNHIDRDKIYCRIIDEDGSIHPVKVHIRWFTCNDCGKVFCAADAPFVPGVWYAVSILDLALYHADLPFHQIEHKLADMGIQLDRDTIRNYFREFGKRVHRKRQGRFRGSDETYSADILEILFGEKEAEKIKKGIRGVADETYPTKKGEIKKHREKNKELKQEGKEEEKYPKGFTVAMSYAVNLKCYCSLLVSLAPFNRIMAEELLMCMRKALYVITDGHQAYAGLIERHLRCIIHLFRNTWKKYNRKKKYPKGFFKEAYEQFARKKLEEMYKKYPMVFDKRGSFRGGSMSTNAIEGGNWRLKYMLKTLYSNLDSIFGRSVALCIKESMYTFKGGEPNESKAHRKSNFTYAEAFMPG